MPTSFIFLIEILIFLKLVQYKHYFCDFPLRFLLLLYLKKNLECSGSWENENLYGLEQLIYVLYK